MKKKLQKRKWDEASRHHLKTCQRAFCISFVCRRFRFSNVENSSLWCNQQFSSRKTQQINFTNNRNGKTATLLIKKIEFYEREKINLLKSTYDDDVDKRNVNNIKKSRKKKKKDSKKEKRNEK